jgi:hypothetical protein
MSYEELRSLVVELIEPDADDDPVNEFETQLTTFQPSKPRTSTLDQLIAWLKAAPPQPNEASGPNTRRAAERLPTRDRRR